MATTLRLRHDSWRDAGKWRAILLGAVPDPRKEPHRYDELWPAWIQTHDEAKVGDVWRIQQRPFGPHIVYSYRGNDPTWPVSHYALVCPVRTCPDGIHMWAHAYNCPALSTFGAPCKRGAGRLSCWDWTGSVESGTLTAQPSLQVLPCPDKSGKPTTCQFHGYLREGVLQ